MPTLWNRLWRHDFVSLTLEQKSSLGRLISEDFRKNNTSFRPTIISHEPHGRCKVILYPKEYAERMDEIIFNFCAGRLIKPTPEAKEELKKITPQWEAKEKVEPQSTESQPEPPIQEKQENNKLDNVPRGTSVKRERRRIPLKQPERSVKYTRP
jgi:hypothetical protein